MSQTEAEHHCFCDVLELKVVREFSWVQRFLDSMGWRSRGGEDGYTLQVADWELKVSSDTVRNLVRNLAGGDPVAFCHNDPAHVTRVALAAVIFMILTFLVASCMLSCTKWRSWCWNLVPVLVPGIVLFGLSTWYAEGAIPSHWSEHIDYYRFLYLSSLTLLLCFAGCQGRRMWKVNKSLKVIHMREVDGETYRVKDLLGGARGVCAGCGDAPADVGTRPSGSTWPAIRLVRTSWLLKETTTRLRRRQDLERECEEEAFWPVEEAVKLFNQNKVAVLSYRWLRPGNPDPDGFHLKQLKRFARSSLGKERCAMFIDFCSICQHSENAGGPERNWEAQPPGKHEGDRTQEEEDMFNKALKVMTCFYASPLTIVVQHTHLPEDSDERPYAMSGWCQMEQAAAQLMHEGGVKLYRLDMDQKWSLYEPRSWSCFRMDGVTHVEPVPTYKRGTDLSTETMREFFMNEEKCDFYGGKDRKDVADMYAAFHESLQESIKKFDKRNRNSLDRFSDWFTNHWFIQARIGVSQKIDEVKEEFRDVDKEARKKVACCFLQLPLCLILIAVIGTSIAASFGVLSNKMGILLTMSFYLIMACCVGVARYSDVVRDYVQRDLPEQWAYQEENDEEQCSQCTARCCVGSALFFERHSRWMETVMDLDAYRNARKSLSRVRELKGLLDTGVLTQEEFVQLKATILSPSTHHENNAPVVPLPRPSASVHHESNAPVGPAPGRPPSPSSSVHFESNAPVGPPPGRPPSSTVHYESNAPVAPPPGAAPSASQLGRTSGGSNVSHKSSSRPSIQSDGSRISAQI